MEHLPIFVSLSGRSVLLVGGGEGAARKLRLLARTPARIVAVAPKPGAEIAAAATRGAIELLARPFRREDVAERALVFVTEADETAADVAAAARAADVPVNVTDRPDLSSFLMPAIVDRDPIVIGIGSGGTAPLLARELRARIESLLPARLGQLAEFAGRCRSAVAAGIPEAPSRRRFWEWLLTGPIAEAVLAGRVAEAEAALAAHLAQPESALSGHVALVGCGPGDPDLLTFRALRVMQAADLVLHDDALGPRLLDYIRRDAERVALAPASSGADASAEVLTMIAARARAGARVVWLKTGAGLPADAEAQILRAADLHVEIVPGVASIRDCPLGPGGP
jgi:uroporphyrin-III C-methyltransferase/precorrin-2 dehydrogenase/sirohydrochlorin ferrochelatase